MSESWYDTLNRAYVLGRECAETAIESGDKIPEESPLSGEFVGRITVRDVVYALTGNPAAFRTLEDWELTDIADFWEDGYNSAEWPGEPQEAPEPAKTFRGKELQALSHVEVYRIKVYGEEGESTKFLSISEEELTAITKLLDTER